MVVCEEKDAGWVRSDRRGKRGSKIRWVRLSWWVGSNFIGGGIGETWASLLKGGVLSARGCPFVHFLDVSLIPKNKMHF